MRLIALIILVMTFACSSQMRQSCNDSTDASQKVPVEFADLEVRGSDLSIRGDSLFVYDHQLLFGEDLNIRIIRKASPFGRKADLEIVNLSSDCLTITYVGNSDFPSAELYRGPIDRGEFRVQIPVPSGLVDVKVGQETKRAIIIH